MARRARHASASVRSSPMYIATRTPVSRSRARTAVPLSMATGGRISSTSRPGVGTSPRSSASDATCARSSRAASGSRAPRAWMLSVAPLGSMRRSAASRRSAGQEARRTRRSLPGAPPRRPRAPGPRGALDLHAVVARVRDPVEPHDALGVGQAPPAHEADQAHPVAQLDDRLAHPVQQPRVLRAGDDRGDRAVERRTARRHRRSGCGVARGHRRCARIGDGHDERP